MMSRILFWFLVLFAFAFWNSQLSIDCATKPLVLGSEQYEQNVSLAVLHDRSITIIIPSASIQFLCIIVLGIIVLIHFTSEKKNSSWYSTQHRTILTWGGGGGGLLAVFYDAFLTSILDGGERLA
jgi:hypothetical protein